MIVLMLGTAVFVPLRIVYKQNQSPDVKPGEVAIVNFEFEPVALTVPAGTEVTFSNSDGATHTATANDKSFDSGRLEQGESFATKITASADYFCEIHDYMTATIKVSG